MKDEDDILLGHKGPSVDEQIKAKRDFEALFEKKDSDSDEGESSDAKGVADAGAIKPARQFKYDASSESLKKFVELLLQRNSLALTHFLDQLKNNRVAAKAVIKIVELLAKSKNPLADKVVGLILDAAPQSSLREKISHTATTIKKELGEELHRSMTKTSEQQAKPSTSPYKNPGKIPENKIGD